MRCGVENWKGGGGLRKRHENVGSEIAADEQRVRARAEGAGIQIGCRSGENSRSFEQNRGTVIGPSFCFSRSLDSMLKVTVSLQNKRLTIIELKKEAGSLRRANEDLQKRVYQLQKKRFGMGEDLVYTRWLDICLRFKAEDFYSISRKNPTDSSHCDYRREWRAEYIKKTEQILRAVSKGSDSSQTLTESHGISNSTAKFEQREQEAS